MAASSVSATGLRAPWARRGAVAGVWGAAALIAWVMACGEISAAPTAVDGVASSTWTGVTAVTAVVFGDGALHGSFDLGAIAFGIAALGVLGAALGVAVAAFIDVSLGPLPSPAGAALLGVGVGLAAEVLLMNVLAVGLQRPDTLYRAIPPWGWWVGSVAFGAIAGLRLARTGTRG